MSKIRTVTDLLDRLNKDSVWRLREISDLKTSVKLASGSKSHMLVRAGIMLLYAHWEGFVKNASLFYLEFVANQRLKYEQLKTCFVALGFKGELNQIVDSKQHAKNARAIDFIRSELSKQAHLVYQGAIDTKSNLSSSAFQTIAESIGLDITPYQTQFNFIDESLLSRRNKVAHGEYLESLDLKPNDYSQFSDDVVTLMRTYKNDIENSAIQKSYLV